jgi:hypothetical protein
MTTPKQFLRTVEFLSTTNASGSSSGSVIIFGGLNIQKDVLISGNVNVSGMTTFSNIAISGSLVTSSGSSIVTSQWSNNGSNLLYFGSNGSMNVGINTSTPSFNLDINGTARFSSGITTSTLTSTSSTIPNSVFTNISSASIISTNLINTNSSITNLINTNIISTNNTLTNLITTSFTSNGLLLTNGSLIATFNSNTIGSIFTTNGNIGINNTAPTVSLDVIGTGKFTNLTSAFNTIANLITTNLTSNSLLSTNLITTNNTLTNLINTNSSITNLINTNTISTNNTLTNLITTSFTSNGLLLTNGSLVATFNSNTIGTIFTTNGNVGINNTSPTVSLDVIGTGKFTNLISTNTSIGTLSNINIISTNNTLTNLITTNTSIGTLSNINIISTNNTLTNLISTNTSIGTLSNINIISTNNTLTNLISTFNTFTNLLSTNASLGSLVVNNNIQNTGYTYIKSTSIVIAANTSSSNYKIANVTAGIYTCKFRVQTNDGSFTSHQILNFEISNAFGNNGTGGPAIRVQNSTYNPSTTGDISTILFCDIGDSSQDIYLVMKSSASATYTVTIYLLEDSSNSINLLTPSIATPSGYIYYFSVQSSISTLLANEYTQFAMTHSGYIGINTTNPSYTLDVNGTSRITGGILAINNNNTLGNLYTTGGNVGINNTAPTVSLDVIGTGKFTNLTSTFNTITNLTCTNTSISSLITTNHLSTNNTLTNLISAFNTLTNLISTNSSIGILNVAGNMTVGGNLIVAGTLTSVNVTSVNVIDNNITAGSLNANSAIITNLSYTNGSCSSLNISAGLTAAFIGISNTSPSYTLDINSSSATDSIRIQNSNASGYATIRFQNNSGTTQFMGIGGSSVGATYQNKFYVTGVPSYFANGDASSSTVTGCVVVTGGIGVSGNANIGGSLYISNGQNINIGTSGSSSGLVAHGSLTGTNLFADATNTGGLPALAYITPDTGSGNVYLEFGTGYTTGSVTDFIFTGISATPELLRIRKTGNINIPATIPSASTTSGSLTTLGGIGIGGNGYFGGNIYSNNISASTLQLTQNKIGSLGYIYSNQSTGGNSFTTDLKSVSKRIRTTRTNAVNCVKTWTTRSAASSGNWGNFIWSPELGIFAVVNVASNTSAIQTSPDGINWTARTTPNLTYQGSLIWVSELGMFLMGTSTSTNNIVTSTDGITWTTQTTPSVTPATICWSPELYLLVASNGGSLMTSNNGTSWGSVISNSGHNILSMIWSSELSLFVGAEYSAGNGGFSYSSNGTSWTFFAGLGGTNWLSVCYSPELSLFVGCSQSGTTNNIATSTDGINWTLRTGVSGTPLLNLIIWAPEVSLFMVGQQGGNIYSSHDAINWTLRLSTSSTNYIAWSPELSMFCVAIYGTSTVYTSNLGLPTISNFSPRSCNAIWYSTSTQTVNNYVGSVGLTAVQNNKSPLNTGTGVFTCGFNGIYTCSITFFGNAASQANMFLYRNGSNAIDGLLAFHNNVSASCSGTVSIYCNKGDTLGFYLTNAQIQQGGTGLTQICSIALTC